ncbi:ribosome biogenesis factor YjgA [Aliiglaciecola sp. LCG003]|uniref:ribosome biogenesis factor YjgA n=1 Tax=Aliiglaciecola sp. LCG003 TaxID=3053655 RepID=UPI0025743DB1|nr:ribosome biogenesis factor YjgA [Aliiglaciecola sp. LCG003]WJG09724.1 ribosome biogenesis factor YjgA [Aliiglaciecola sp. LCG003]
MSDTNSTDPENQIKSKTQLKQESNELQKLGEALVDLGQAALAKIPLDDELSDAVNLARKINRKKEGFRRQLQLIGKLMRHRDTQPIQFALDQLQLSHRQQTQKFHHFETARDQVLQQGDVGINALLNVYPDLDRQKLRQFARQADKQQQENKPPKAARELFQYLKDNMS